MVKNAIYWAGRHEQWFKNQDKLDEAVSKRLEKEYKRTAKELEVEIASYFQRYGMDNVVQFRTMMQQLDKADRDLLFQDMDSFALKYPEYAHLLPVRESIYQLNRLEGLHYSTQMKLLELGAIEQQQLEKHLEATYGKRYKEMLEELGIGHSFLAINNEVMKSTLYARWVNAQNFSDRIWTDKQRLLDQLRTRYRDGVARGDNYEKLIKEIRKRMDVGYKNARRLVWTEAAFVLNQAHIHAYQNAGVEEYKISAILDSKTSPICRDMDGQVFKFADMKVGTNFPPFHPYCRTTFIGILEGAAADKAKATDPGNRQGIEKVHDAIFDQFAERETLKKEFGAILDKMSPDDLLLYDKLGQHIKNNNYKYKGGAHYSPRDKMINMGMTQNVWEKHAKTGRTGAFQTKFHEEFHQLDDLLANTKFAATSKGLTHDFISLTSPESVYGSKMLAAVEADVLNAINQAIDWANQRDGTKTRKLKDLSRISSGAKLAFSKYLKENYRTQQDKAFITMFTDAMGGVTKAKISPHTLGFWGHSNAYYAARGQGVVASEAWAEFGAYKFAYTDEAKAAIEKLMPKTIEAYEGVYEEITDFASKNQLKYLKKKR